MALPQLKEDARYTYADLLEWDEDVRAELHDGELVMMSPPVTRHQRVLTELIFQIRTYLEGKSCLVFAAPFGVRLFPKKDKSDDTVFEPDIVVICDEEKLDERGCNGPPDLVIEITSPSTAKYDRIYKLRKYQKAGVREYWIVDPETKSVQVCTLENGRYVTSVYDETDKIPVFVLGPAAEAREGRGARGEPSPQNGSVAVPPPAGCEVDLAGVFAE